MKRQKDYRRKSAVIVCHDVMFGPPHELRNYLLEHKIARLIFIGHRNRALPENDIHRSYCAIYRNGVKIRTNHAPDISRLPEFAAYVIDCLWTLYWVLKYTGRADYYFGLGNMNACVGLILKFMGKVRKVIYYVIDYIPNRYSNPFINRFYMRLDYWSALHSDATWNYAPKMISLREEMWNMTFPHQAVVPNGVRIRVPGTVKRDGDHIDLMYLGTIHRQQGIQLVIKALPLIKKNIPQIRLRIIGQGSYENDLGVLIRKNKLEKQVRFLGYIEDPNKVDEQLAQGYIGVATYTPDNNMVRNTEPGKIKRYFACGLPVIMTDTGPTTKLSIKAGCGISIPYNATILAQEVIRLVSDRQRYEDMRKSARAFAKRYDWEQIFSRGFQSL
jgi:glycosyltransferase involved in cell wall biosynthesis